MTEESIIVPITPEIVIPDVVRSRSSEGKLIGPKGRATKQPDPRRASTGSSGNGGKKVSSGKPSPLSNGKDLVPHYLRASTGSCHDFCKYGKKLETEVKPWQVKARKVINPTLNHQNGLESGDVSEKSITQAVKSKPRVSKTNSFLLSAVSGRKSSSPSNELTIPSRPVSAQGKIMTVNEKKNNVLEIRNTLVFSGRRESKTNPGKTKETSKETTRNIVSFPVVKRATRPSHNGDSSLKVNAKNGKELLSPPKDQNKISKAELKQPTDFAVEEKTLHVINLEAKNTNPESKEKNQEGIKEIEKEIVEHKNPTDEAFPFLEVYSEKLVFDLKHNENAFDPPSFELFPSPEKSPSSYDKEETQDEVGYIDSDKKVLESKQNEKTFDSPKSDSFPSHNIPSPVKSPALSYGEEESQDELENTSSEKRIPELKQNESTYSPPPESLSSPNILSPVKSPALSYIEEEAHDEVEYTSTEKKVPELKQSESTIDSSPSESFPSPTITSIIKSPVLSYGEEKASDEVEYTYSEKKVLETKPKGTIDSPPSESSSSSSSSSNISSTDPALLYGEEQTKDEVEYTNSEKKVFESKQNERTVAYIPSLVKSSALLYVDDETQDEVVYLDSEMCRSDDSISETSEILYSDEEETSVENHNSKTRMVKSFSTDDDKATKLKFRRGKVIEIESNDTSPRRLKFRRAKIIGENITNDSNSRRSSYERRGVDDMNGTKDDSEKVVLRHQQVEGKKDAQGLFNNVIEETAIKLAETRKSKVKALVGAFETVISLQESKPSS